MQLSVMRTRASQRLNEGVTGPVYYPAAEITAALNEALRYFCLLTLCLEQTSSWTPAAGFTRMLTVFTDWICPLRITTAAGAKVRPATIGELNALDPEWIARSSAISRYVSLGADCLGVYGQTYSALTVTYARAAAALALDTDVPEIPAEYHGDLVSYAIYRLRQAEGLQEFEKAIAYFNDFMSGAKVYAAYVRARNLGARYDKIPPEDEFFDRSKLKPRTPANLIPSSDGTALPEAS